MPAAAAQNVAPSTPAAATPAQSQGTPSPGTPLPPSKPKDLDTPDKPAAEKPKSDKDADSSSRNELHKFVPSEKKETIPDKKEEKESSSDSAPDEAYGGQINRIEDPNRLSAMPLGRDKRGTSGREDTALLYNNKVKAYINKDEGVKYDSNTNKLNITPTQRTRADSLLDRQNERKMAPPLEVPKPENRATMQAHTERARNLKEDIMHPPTSNWGNQSTERAYTRSKFYEPGDHIAGYHFNSGASNFRSS